MERIIFITLACLTLVACGGKRERIKIQKEYIPVSSVPMPPDTNRPVLYTERLSDEQKQDAGVVAQSYKISIKQLQSYSNILEQIIAEYRHLAIESKKELDLLQRFTQRQPEDSSPVGPMSYANPENTEVTFSEVVGQPEFNFQREFDQWETEQRLKQLQDDLNNIDDTNPLNIDEDN